MAAISLVRRRRRTTHDLNGWNLGRSRDTPAHNRGAGLHVLVRHRRGHRCGVDLRCCAGRGASRRPSRTLAGRTRTQGLARKARRLERMARPPGPSRLAGWSGLLFLRPRRRLLRTLGRAARLVRFRHKSHSVTKLAVPHRHRFCLRFRQRRTPRTRSHAAHPALVAGPVHYADGCDVASDARCDFPQETARNCISLQDRLGGVGHATAVMLHWG